MTLSADVTLTETEHGAVVLNERTGRYWTLNCTGTAVIRLLMAGRTAEEAAVALRADHPEVADRVAVDVEAFLATLYEAKVLVP